MQNPPICDYEGSDYQQRFWQEGRRSYEDAVEAVALRRLLPPQGGQHLLELGAGAGRNTPRYHNYKYVTLVDYSRTQLEQARQALGDSERFTYVQADAYHLPFFAGVFDAATMIRTLHHMAEPRQVLDQVRYPLLKDAVFILEYANKHNLKSILRYMLHQQTWNPFSPNAVEFVPLNYNFHPATIRAWLSDSRFSVERQLTVSHLRMGLFKRLLPLKLLVALDSLFQLTGNQWQLTPSVFVLGRATGDTLPAQEGQFFRCPACGAEGLMEDADRLVCPTCGRSYSYSGGIYDFRVKP